MGNDLSKNSKLAIAVVALVLNTTAAIVLQILGFEKHLTSRWGLWISESSMSLNLLIIMILFISVHAKRRTAERNTTNVR